MLADEENSGKGMDLNSHDTIITDSSDDDELCLMAREEPKIQSKFSSSSIIHSPELSSESVGELDLQFSLERLMVDFSRLQEAHSHLEEENEKLTAENLQLTESTNQADLKSASLTIELTNELEALKGQIKVKDNMIKDLLMIRLS